MGFPGEGLSHRLKSGRVESIQKIVADLRESPSIDYTRPTMFTGLVEGLAEVKVVLPEGSARRVCVAAGPEPAKSTKIGDSVALNGCCLTLVASDPVGWWFQAGFETLAKTNLGELFSGQFVNWERALPVDGRLGGHFVQGHVDGVGIVDSITHDGEWCTMWFRVPAELSLGMVPKGSIAVDGVSLTLVQVESLRFSVMLIPHTMQATTLGRRQVGDTVNIETDILGKYVLKLIQLPGSAGAGNA